MKNDEKKRLKELLLTPGISGFEEKAREVWKKQLKGIADSTFTDANGSEIATLDGDNPATSLLLLGHIDQIGLIVRYIDDNGYLYFAPVGGIDPETLVSQPVRVCGPKGDISGVIGKLAIHLMDPEARKKKSRFKDMWIDIGASSKSEAQEYAPIGTPVMVGEEHLELLNDRIASRHDNRFGAFVIAEVLRRLKKKQKELFPTVHAAATVQEESGLPIMPGAGAVAHRLMPTAAIAVDVNHAMDIPGGDKRTQGDAKMGKGVIISVGVSLNNKLVNSLIEVAKKHKIPYQLEFDSGRGFTDADVLPMTRTGIPGAYVGIPLRYMHNTIELASYKDIESVIELLVKFSLSIEGEIDYTP